MATQRVYDLLFAGQPDENPNEPVVQAARRAKPDKRYTFRRSPFGRARPYVIVSVPGGAMPGAIEVSDATYDRFAALANSGRYVVEILDSDYGIAWRLRRPLDEIAPPELIFGDL